MLLSRLGLEWRIVLADGMGRQYLLKISSAQFAHKPKKTSKCCVTCVGRKGALCDIGQQRVSIVWHVPSQRFIYSASTEFWTS